MPTVTVQPTRVTSTGWSDPGNLALIDTNFGFITLLPTGDAQIVFNCAHTLPAGATVTGIRVGIAVASSAGTQLLWSVVFALHSDFQADSSTSLNSLFFGSTSNAYGVTRASLAAGFSIEVSATENTDLFSTDARFDGITVEVTYTEASGEPAWTTRHSTTMLVATSG